MKKILILSILIAASTIVHAQNIPFIAHEWGTFTTLQRSDGKHLSGLQKDEEALPRFVQNISSATLKVSELTQKGYYVDTRFDNVTVKMETPVIYFYSDKQKNVTVDVHFKQGAISQWYPERNNGESRDFGEYVDFSEPKTGWIEWNASVLAPDNTSAPNDLIPWNNESYPEWETDQWIRPRATASNLIKGSEGEIEKFLFYRGIANFDVPVKVEFNTAGNLLITNNYPEELSYVMVYDKEKENQPNIWWSGVVDRKYIKVIQKPTSVTGSNALANEMNNFEDNLVNAGLYRDEARAMLNTWKESYFEHDGLRVFWIVARSLTDSILPINISPQPDKLERVMVGRSEILTPEFEKTIKEESKSDFDHNYSSDRFYLAYNELRNDLSQTQLTTINSDKSLIGIDELALNTIRVYPNPADETENIEINIANSPQEVIIELYNSIGAKVYSANRKIVNGKSHFSIDVSDLVAGIYLIKIQTSAENLIGKIIKQ